MSSAEVPIACPACGSQLPEEHPAFRCPACGSLLQRHADDDDEEVGAFLGYVGTEGVLDDD